MAPKGNANRNRKLATVSALASLKRDLRVNCYKGKPPLNPPSTLNSGDVWHNRVSFTTTLAGSGGTADLTAGKFMSSLSGNAANVPIRINSITAWAIAGTAGTYPPSFMQVNFENQEFTDSASDTSFTPNYKDSLSDSGGQGAGPPGVMLCVPRNIQLIRADWTLNTTTVLATAAGLPSGANVYWRINSDFKF
jgi:hypothetical protein